MTVQAMEMGGVAVAERPTREATDHQLVSAVRRGDDRAFEELYKRYQGRITGYVGTRVGDHARAEDITQEVFVSALRRMRETERPIAFKPWIYEIAKNACIDAYRRGRRAEEVPYDADDRLSAADQGRLVASAPEPDAAVAAKQDLDRLCGAFGGLSDAHWEILVMREFEDYSYNDIGERLGMSRSAVESTLFRARKRLGEEYDELASGERCLRMQAIVDEASAGSRLRTRDARRLARHVSHCRPCRRLAAQAGLDLPVPVRRRVAERIAAWLPFPAFLRLRRHGEEVGSARGAEGAGGWLAHAPVLADSMSTGWSKAATGIVTLVVAGAGVGATTQVQIATGDEGGSGYQAAAARTSEHGAASAPRAADDRAPTTGAAAAPSGAGATQGSEPAQGGGPAAKPAAGNGGTSSGSGGAHDGAKPAASAPATTAPQDGAPGSAVKKVADSATGAGRDTPLNKVTDALEKPVNKVTGALADKPVSKTTGAVEKPVDKLAGAVDKPVNKVAGALDKSLSKVPGPLNKPVSEVTGALADKPVSKVTGAVEKPVNKIAGALDEPVGKLAGAVADKPVSKLAGAVADKPVSKLAGAVADKPVSKLVGAVADKPVSDVAATTASAVAGAVPKTQQAVNSTAQQLPAPAPAATKAATKATSTAAGAVNDATGAVGGLLRP